MDPIYLSAAFAIVGAVVYLASNSPKPTELGRLSFIIGLSTFLLEFGGKIIGSIHR